MSADTRWYLLAYGIFVLFNGVAILGALFSHQKQWRIDLTQYRHFTSLIFNVCGIIYALFLGFIIWDVWERFYEVKKKVQDEGKYLVDLYRDSKLLGPDFSPHVEGALKNYIYYVIDSEWDRMASTSVLAEGDALVENIWRAFIAFDPKTMREQTAYAQTLSKLNALSDARMARIFNIESSVGPLRWTLLILGGLVLVTIPCFFKIDYLTFKLVLTLFLANIISFMLFIIYSLDNPFTGHVEIHPKAFEYAIRAIRPNPSEEARHPLGTQPQSGSLR